MSHLNRYGKISYSLFIFGAFINVLIIGLDLFGGMKPPELVDRWFYILFLIVIINFLVAGSVMYTNRSIDKDKNK